MIELNPSPPLVALGDKRVLVTGAAGSIGTALTAKLAFYGIQTLATDSEDGDVTSLSAVSHIVHDYRPDVVFHLAGAKHAPVGEEDPYAAAMVNAIGTSNVLAAVGMYARGARVVTASSCKACSPETAYGASKLIAERMTLNAGGSVARFHNVVETQGNVFEIWKKVPAREPLPVTPCLRFFISLGEALVLLLWASVLRPARYAIDPGLPRQMEELAAALYPGRKLRRVPPRRGDRIAEPFHASYEHATPLSYPDGLLEISSPHDH